MSGPVVLGLLVAAVVAGLDLVSAVQGLFSRPIVVGLASGLIIGDVETGLRVGAVLELFALDVVPVGAARYPDFGAATAAAVLYAAGTDWTTTLGAAAGLGLLIAIAAGATLPLTRRWNAATVGRAAARLDAGDPSAVTRVHLTCLGHDVVRSVLVALAALGFGLGLRVADVRPPASTGELLGVVVIGGAVFAAAHGATLSAPGEGRRGLFVVGSALGLLAVLI